MPSFFCRSSSSDNSCARGSGRKKKRKKDKFWAINSDTNWPFPRAETRAFRAPTRGARAGTSAVSLQTHREARAAAMVTFEAWGGGWQTEGEGLKKKDREKSVSLKEKGGRERVFFSSLSFFFFFCFRLFFCFCFDLGFFFLSFATAVGFSFFSFFFSFCHELRERCETKQRIFGQNCSTPGPKRDAKKRQRKCGDFGFFGSLLRAREKKMKR